MRDLFLKGGVCDIFRGCFHMFTFRLRCVGNICSYEVFNLDFRKKEREKQAKL